MSTSKTLVHEFAHVLLGHLGPLGDAVPLDRWNKDTRDRLMLPVEAKELEAEAVVYIVDRMVGVKGNSTGYLLPYVQQLRKNRPIGSTNLASLRFSRYPRRSSTSLGQKGD